MRDIEFLLNFDKKRMLYEKRGEEYDKLRKREERKREVMDITRDLFFECDAYKNLRLNDHEKERVIFLVNKFGNEFKKLHRTVSREAIILTFIFFIKKNNGVNIKLSEYRITSKYNLTDDVFEIILCRLLEYYMKKCPIPVTQTDKYDHELLSKNAGEI